jgi:hypothetical protein
MKALVIEPGHGSTWLHDAHYEGVYVVGEAWDDSGVGSALMPDDFRGEPMTLSFPRRFILKVEEASRD